MDFSGDFTSNDGVAISIGVLQDGNTFWTHFPAGINEVVNSATFVPVSLSATAASDFTRLDGTAGNPDFTASGSVVTLGYFVRRGDAGAGGRDFDIVTDNASFTVVPEASHFGVLAGLTGLLFALRRRRR